MPSLHQRAECGLASLVGKPSVNLVSYSYSGRISIDVESKKCSMHHLQAQLEHITSCAMMCDVSVCSISKSAITPMEGSDECIIHLRCRSNATTAHLISPTAATGSNFVMYMAKLAADGSAGLPPRGLER